MAMRYRIHFEPIDVEAMSPYDALKNIDNIPDIRSIYLIDENGFPINGKR